MFAQRGHGGVQSIRGFEVFSIDRSIILLPPHIAQILPLYKSYKVTYETTLIFTPNSQYIK